MKLEEDNEEPKLCDATAAILAEFLAEQQRDSVSVKEDWQLSQFWYEDSTATVLAEECIRAAGPSGKIVCVSCPTAFRKLKDLKPSNVEIALLEYDRRFWDVHGDLFTFYDYNHPTDVPPELLHRFDVVFCDPPFLSSECQEKVSLTAKLLGKPDAKFIVCTGAQVQADVKQFFNAVPVEGFVPKHENNLANEFCCYLSYPNSRLSE